MVELVQRFLQNQSNHCENLFNEYILGNFTDIRCPPSFDGILCWPSTLAPGVALLNCPPKFVLGYKNPGDPTASKTCLADGKWYRNEKQVTWSNYTLCAPRDGEYVTEIIDIDIDFWDDTFNTSSTLVTEWVPFILTVSQIGNASSFTALVIAMVVFSSVRRLRNPRNRLHMHLFASFSMRAFMTLLKDWLFVNGVTPAWDIVSVNGTGNYIKMDNLWVCKSIISVWEYFILSNYMWIFMEGLYFHNLVCLNACTDTPPITKYAMWGWVLPSLVVVIWIVARILFDDTLCWTTLDNPPVFLIIEIPIFISTLCNLLLFINTIRVLFVKMKTSVHLQHKKMQYRRWAKSTLLLVPVYGVHEILLLGFSYDKDTRVVLIWLFCDQLFGSFQGCFVACLYFLLNGEVHAEVARAWKIQRARLGVDLFAISNREPTNSSDLRIGKIGHDDEGHANAGPNVSTLQ